MTKKKTFQRTDRMGDLVRRIVSETLMAKVHHRGVEDVTVTQVRVSSDLQHARVFYRVLDISKRAHAARALAKACSLIQTELAKQMHTRYTPVLRFEYDHSLEQGNRIEDLLKLAHQPCKEDQETNDGGDSSR